MKGEEYVCDNRPKKRTKNVFFSKFSYSQSSLNFLEEEETSGAHIDTKEEKKSDPNSCFFKIQFDSNLIHHQIRLSHFYD